MHIETYDITGIKVISRGVNMHVQEIQENLVIEKDCGGHHVREIVHFLMNKC